MQCVIDTACVLGQGQMVCHGLFCVYISRRKPAMTVVRIAIQAVPCLVKPISTWRSLPSLPLVPTHLHETSAVTHTHMHISSACLSSGCARCVPVAVSVPPFSNGGASCPLVVDFTPCCVKFLGGRVVFLCLVLFAARLSVFLCAPPVLCYFCLLCLFRSHGDGLLGAASLRWGWGRTPTLPPCACMLLLGILVGCS